MDNQELVLDKIDELLGEVQDCSYGEAFITLETIKYLLVKLVEGE